MLNELNDQLAAVKEKLRVRERLLGRLDRAAQTLDQERARLADLQTTLAAEALDVKKLEGLSLTALFRIVLGSKETQLEKERQEYLAAKLKYDACAGSVAALEADVSDLQRKVATFGALDTEYQTVLDAKEQLLGRMKGGQAETLVGLSETLGQTRAEAKEFNEAIEAGNAALGALEQMIASLRSARNWGTWDMIGGGLITTAIKHSKIDDARSLAHGVQQMLQRFQRELADVDLASGVTVEMGSMATFADYFFDGLIIDWVVQSRINKSLDCTTRAAEQVRRTLAALNERLNQARERLRDIDTERRSLIENA
jgi:chromosome segregation ATPase